MAVRKSKRSSEQATFALAEGLILRAAAPLATALLQRRGHDLTLNAAGVRQLGGQCLQILLAARTAWQADGYRLHVADPSAEFMEALSLLGAESLVAADEPPLRTM